MRVFLDANVLVTVLCNEYPRFTACSRVLSLCDDPRFEVYTSPISIAISAYFAEKKGGRKLAKKKMAVLTQRIRITTIDEAMTREAASNPKVDDVEDGLQYFSAVGSGAKCIVSYDRHDFHFSDIEVLDAEQFLLKYAVRK